MQPRQDMPNEGMEGHNRRMTLTTAHHIQQRLPVLRLSRRGRPETSPLTFSAWRIVGRPQRHRE